MTKKAARQQKAEWNRAIAESRMVRTESGFRSFLTTDAACQFIRLASIAGQRADLVDPSLAQKAVR